MKFDETLIAGKIVNRFHRVIVDVMLEDGTTVPAYCPDFTDIENIYEKDVTIWLSKNTKTSGNLKYICELVTKNDDLICINNKHNYSIIKEAYKAGKISEFLDYDKFTDLPDSSLLDFKLENSKTGEKFYVGSASVCNKRNSDAIFPTYLYFGEQKMLDEMLGYIEDGSRGVFVLIVPRTECASTKFVWDIDPNSANLLLEYKKKNIEFISYNCFIDKEKIEIDKKLPLIF